MVTYSCEGCGITVHLFGRTVRPAHQWCEVCLWLNEYVSDPEEITTSAHKIGHFGHERSERGLA